MKLLKSPYSRISHHHLLAGLKPGIVMVVHIGMVLEGIKKYFLFIFYFLL